jgi:hypothetical protein
MNYAQLIRAVKAALEPLAAAEGGQVIAAATLEQARTFLKSAPRGWRLVLHWEGYGEHPEARLGMTAHQVATVIQAPAGLDIDRDPTRDKPGGAKGFHHYITLVDGWMRALRFPNGSGADIAGFSLSSSQWLETLPTHAAHVISWRVDAALPAFPTHIPLVLT